MKNFIIRNGLSELRDLVSLIKIASKSHDQEAIPGIHALSSEIVEKIDVLKCCLEDSDSDSAIPY